MADRDDLYVDEEAPADMASDEAGSGRTIPTDFKDSYSALVNL